MTEIICILTVFIAFIAFCIFIIIESRKEEKLKEHFHGGKFKSSHIFSKPITKEELLERIKDYNENPEKYYE